MDFISTHATCNASDGSNATFASNDTLPGGGAGACDPACLEHGLCIDGACSCNTGYTGPACNITSYTDHFECGYQCTFKQGTCAVTSVKGTDKWWGCQCNAGFSGATCSLFSCPSNCNYAGACLDKGVCACFPGFQGAACEIDCGCNGHGMCTANGTACLCDAGYRPGPSGCEPDCAGCAAGAAACAAPGECGCAGGCANGACFNGRCECWSGYVGATCSELSDAARPNRGSPVGIEVAGPAYWSTSWTWINVMAQSNGGWFTQRAQDSANTNVSAGWDIQAKLDLSADGYPLSLPDGVVAHKLALRDVQLHAMPGRYVALWDGDGVLDVGFDAKVAAVAKGRLEFDFTPTANPDCAATGAAYCGDNGIWVVLRATNPANPLRNLRVVPRALEGVASRQPFHPWFLQDMARYAVLRFTAWLRTNTDALAPWAQRTLPSADSQAGPGGVAWEHLVGLCNQLGASPWVNIHHLADDGYVRSVAAFLKAQLRPDVRVYVEHSNEVWNTGFPQGKYARQKGLELGLSAKEDVAGYLWHGKRSAEIFSIFEDVWGPEARRQRLKFVVGTWGYVCSGSWGVGCGATALNATLSYGGVAQKADAVAVGAYFSCSLGQSGAADALLSVDDMVAKCMADSEVASLRSNLQTLKDAAAGFGLPLATYEAGPSVMESSVIFNGGGTQAAALKYIALQRDPRFEAVYAKYLQLFDQLGLISTDFPYMHFSSVGTPSKYGSWGLLEFTGQDRATAPKHRALHAVLDAKQLAGVKPGCLHPDLGPAGLADGQYSGAPAITSPGKGAVWVQGVEYNVTFPAVRAPSGPVTVDVFRGGDCNASALLASFGPLSVRPAGPFEAFLTLRVPGGLSGPGHVLRVRGSIAGQQAATIYSEAFTVQELQVNGGCNPALPYAPPAARCIQYTAWNVSAGPTGLCAIQDNGCRQYRTAGTAASPWYSTGKPVLDCTSQFSPNPSRAARAAAGLPVGPFSDGGAC